MFPADFSGIPSKNTLKIPGASRRGFCILGTQRSRNSREFRILGTQRFGLARAEVGAKVRWSLIGGRGQADFGALEK